jgi:hypothetical protein
VAARDPVQAPDAAQDVALLADQVKVELPPRARLLGLALKEIVGGEGTVTVTDWEAEPPVPVQVSV